MMVQSVGCLCYYPVGGNRRKRAQRPTVATEYIRRSQPRLAHSAAHSAYKPMHARDFRVETNHIEQLERSVLHSIDCRGMLRDV
jgi:hypothetical protein